MGNGNRVLIISLVVAIIVLVGAVMFLLGKMSAQQPAEPAPTEMAAVPPADPGPVAAQVLPALTLPANFQGKWEEQLKACSDSASTTFMRLTSNQISFLESGGTVTAVTVYSPLEIAFTANMDGEGERWTRTFRFVLSPDQSILTDPADKGGFTRYRCP
jgi:hypothetical protein